MIVSFSIKQCTRRPLKTLLFFVLLTLGSFLLCLGIEFYQYSVQCREQMDGQFTTIAVPNIRKIVRESPGDNFSPLYQKVLEVGEELGMGALDRREGYMGYIPGWNPVVQTGEEGTWDSKHYYKLFAAVVTYVGDRADKSGGIEIQQRVYQVEELLNADPRFVIPEMVQEWASLVTRKEGQRYLMIFQLDEQLMPESEVSENFLQRIQPLSLSKFSKNNGIMEARQNGAEDVSFLLPCIEITGSLEEFLQSDIGKPYQTVLNNISIYQDSAYIMSTDCVESIWAFHQDQAMIRLGRSFTKQEYEQGERVCLISQGAAEENGLSVGDSISFSFYQSEYDFNGNNETAWCVRGDPTLPLAMTEAQSYEIVGIYQVPDWNGKSYQLDPNTIIIPAESLTEHPELTETAYGGTEADMPVGLYGFILPNGQMKAFMDAIAEKGYEDYYLCYDQGYSYVGSTLESLISQAGLLLLICTAVWVAVAILYLLFGVLGCKREIGMLLAFGTGKVRSFLVVLLSSIILVVPASFLGCVLAGQVQEPLTQSVVSQTWEENVMDYRFSDFNPEDSDSNLLKQLQGQNIITTNPIEGYRIAAVQGGMLLLAVCICGIGLTGQTLSMMRKEE